MDDKHVLYSYRRCPYAIRARFALYYAGIQAEIREISFKDKPASMLAISPKGTVPVLQILDGKVIDESLDIMYWALEQNDPNGWLQDTHRQEIARLIENNDKQFKPLLDQYKYFDRHNLTIEAAREQTLFWLEEIESRLNINQNLVTDSFSMADAAIFPFIRQYRGVDTDWFNASKYQKTKNWLAAILDSKALTAIMTKYPVWDASEPKQCLLIPGDHNE